MQQALTRHTEFDPSLADGIHASQNHLNHTETRHTATPFTLQHLTSIDSKTCKKHTCFAKRLHSRSLPVQNPHDPGRFCSGDSYIVPIGIKPSR